MENQIDGTTQDVTLQEFFQSIESDLNDIIMDPSVSGYQSPQEQDIAYGVSFTAGINPITDSVLDVGCGIGEFYHYVERFTGQKIVKYYGVDVSDPILDINKFRSQQDDSVTLLNFNIFDFQQGHELYSADALRNLSVTGVINDRIDWVVMCNMFDETHSVDDIVSSIEFWSKVPEKGAVFTFNVSSSHKLGNIGSMLLTNGNLNNKLIIRSDFLENWISIYIYNSREE